MSTVGTLSSVACEPDEILRMLREQAALYGQLETYAKKQHGLVTQDDTAMLLALLADRQRLSVNLQRLGVRLDPVRRYWAFHHARLTPAQQGEADALLANIRGRLRRVMESDEKDARVLSARKQTAAGSIRATRASGQAVTAYRSAEVERRADRLDAAS